MSTYIVLLGPPGAGKGTQAKLISGELKLAHISTGDLFRENIRNKTELGKKVENILSSGALVPDELTIEMVKERLKRDDCQNGALMDGFPRTIAQAEFFDRMIAEDFGGRVNAVPCIEIGTEELIKRISGRRMCANGHVFHVSYNPPQKDGICDVCQSELIQRSDDCEETVSKRIDAYEKQTAPLIDYYESKGILMRVDGSKDIEDVRNCILAGLAKALK